MNHFSILKYTSATTASTKSKTILVLEDPKREADVVGHG
jgi:hypothetical protein